MPGASRTIHVVERDGDTVRLVGDGPKGRIEVIARMTRTGDTLVLDGLHADGGGPGSQGLGEIRAFARQLGRQEGAKRVEVRGGTRTTGANPGKVPRPITFDVEE